MISYVKIISNVNNFRFFKIEKFTKIFDNFNAFFEVNSLIQLYYQLRKNLYLNKYFLKITIIRNIDVNRREIRISRKCFSYAIYRHEFRNMQSMIHEFKESVFLGKITIYKA